MKITNSKKLNKHTSYVYLIPTVQVVFVKEIWLCSFHFLKFDWTFTINWTEQKHWIQ